MRLQQMLLSQQRMLSPKLETARLLKPEMGTGEVAITVVVIGGAITAVAIGEVTMVGIAGTMADVDGIMVDIITVAIGTIDHIITADIITGTIAGPIMVDTTITTDHIIIDHTIVPAVISDTDVPAVGVGAHGVITAA